MCVGSGNVQHVHILPIHTRPFAVRGLVVSPSHGCRKSSLWIFYLYALNCVIDQKKEHCSNLGIMEGTLRHASFASIDTLHFVKEN
ncbi:Hypothetical protein, putative [Bodo saltans]|uniref:Uncharacterized protein n=1 Tax=Bodo saltans TaxID=75058 RepID=A0A0S4JN48_BODSA|nr:Hypothetical protein, putative [Bodo saltans]|eukprot:CUG90823.1 Hypothetical protein, putative [Bodo saltans]